MIKQGDKVKLKARVAAAFNNNKRPGKVDWADRRGVIDRISANKVNALVLWEGRRTPDEVPITGIDLVESADYLNVA
jgi:hypothetical protein